MSQSLTQSSLKNGQEASKEVLETNEKQVVVEDEEIYDDADFEFDFGFSWRILNRKLASDSQGFKLLEGENPRVIYSNNDQDMILDPKIDIEAMKADGFFKGGFYCS